MPAKGKKAGVGKKKANGYKMPPPIPTGEVIYDPIAKKKWRIGPAIGSGGFGEIYSACDHEVAPTTGTTYPYVVKIEPHENGPLFVEKHFYVRNTNKDDIENFKKSKNLSSFGMPQYYGSGSHTYKNEQFRYLVLERYGQDVWSKFKEAGRSFPAPVVFQIGLQMLDVLEYIHSRGYVHADLKGANILLGMKKGTEHQAYLVDFGLATKLNDKVFKPDPKCAHNGTVEYTSRDAHLGVPTMRGDLEILAYNMLQWTAGSLPWEQAGSAPAQVHQLKTNFMDDVRNQITTHFHNVPDALIEFFEYINTLQPKDKPDYRKCQQIFETYLKSEGKTRTSKLTFTPSKKKTTNERKRRSDAASNANNSIDKTAKLDGAPKAKRGRKPKVKPADSDNENEQPSEDREVKVVNKKRKSSEPAVVVKVKKTKLAPKATPPVKKNHVNIATQTSVDKKRRSPRQVSFDSPICEYIGEKKNNSNNMNSSGDIFDDSFVVENKKVVKKPRTLLAKREVTVKRIRRKKVTTVGEKGQTWKDVPAVVNGRSPPK